MWAPWSQYDPSKLVNIGTNRWSYEAELGISKAMGEWTFEPFELVPGVTFYPDNTNFLDGNTRAQFEHDYERCGARDRQHHFAL